MKDRQLWGLEIDVKKADDSQFVTMLNKNSVHKLLQAATSFVIINANMTDGKIGIPEPTKLLLGIKTTSLHKTLLLSRDNRGECHGKQ